MAAISQPTAEYVGDDYSECRALYRALNNWKLYPYNLGTSVQPNNRPKLIEYIRQHFERTKFGTLMIPEDTPARRKAARKRIRAIWIDHNTRSADASNDTSTTATSESEETDSVPNSPPKLFKSHEDLDEFLRMVSAESRPNPDPECRFIVLESSAPASSRLKITEQMLLKILTYHQVTPYFLNQISHICHQRQTTAREVPFGGFHTFKCFSSPSPGASRLLGRSGLHYQLVFKLGMVNSGGEISPGTAHITTAPGGGALWPITQCAVYHQFDVSTGRFVWILVTPQGISHPGTGAPWNGPPASSEDFFSRLGIAPPPASTVQRFASTLSVLVWLADLSLSEFDSYIDILDEKMQDLVAPFVNAGHGGSSTAAGADGGGEKPPVDEQTLTEYNNFMITLDQCITALESNMRALNGVAGFYCDDLLADRRLPRVGPPWVSLAASSEEKEEPGRGGEEETTARENLREMVEQFRIDMSSVCDSLEEMVSRAKMVKLSGTRLESLTHRLIQVRDTAVMKDLQQLTFFFSTITLFLLPMSVVSTIFSTDIVTFSVPNRANTDGFVGNWSVPALVWWLGVSALATTLVGGLSERSRRRTLRSRESGPGVDVPLGDEEGGMKERLQRVMGPVKRAFVSMENRGMAKVQRVRGKVGRVRKRIADRRANARGLEVEDGVELENGIPT